MGGTIHAAFTTPNIQAIGINWTFGLEIFTGWLSFLPYLSQFINWLRQDRLASFCNPPYLAPGWVGYPHWLANNLTIMGIQKHCSLHLPIFTKKT
jgi:hypothetical protein